MSTTRTRLLSALVAFTLVASACGGDDGASTGTVSDATPDETADESGAAASGGDAATDAAFPVTIEHALGSTTIEAAPERVVTWGWGSADAAIALGVAPVAMPFQSYGGDAEGVLPWVRAGLDERGMAMPTILPQTVDPEIPFEAIEAADPDLILATYSGITDADYELLSAIAPTVAYPDAPWTTPWRDLIEITGTALGRSAEADELLSGIDTVVADAAAAHPELAGRTMSMVWDVAGTFYVYRPADARVQFVEQLGMVTDDSVEALANGDSTFFYTLSTELVGQLDGDVLIAFADTPEAAQTFLDTPYAQTIPAVGAGAVATITGTELIAAVSPPTALSLTWGLDDYVDALARAVGG